MKHQFRSKDTIREYLEHPGNDASRLVQTRVIVAEVDPLSRKMMSKALRASGYLVVEVENGIELLEIFESRVLADHLADIPHIVVANASMAGIAVVAVQAGFGGSLARPMLLLVAEAEDQLTAAEAQELGATALLKKPFRGTQLAELTERIWPPWANVARDL
jgi:CheY-like chemotaxis protein